MGPSKSKTLTVETINPSTHTPLSNIYGYCITAEETNNPIKLQTNLKI